MRDKIVKYQLLSQHEHMDPLQIFQTWLDQETKQNSLKLPNACCLSTVGLDGYPNARFVSLKEIVNDAFVITGPLDSRKGKELNQHPKAAITFWWTATERQVRIQGDVNYLSRQQAEKYFEERNNDSKIVSSIFNQGNPITSIDHLQKKFQEEKAALTGKEIQRPENWGGMMIKPLRIELMEFKKSRLHERRLFQRKNEHWDLTTLEP